MSFRLISLVIFSPLITVVVLLLWRGLGDEKVRRIALAGSLATFVLSLPLFFLYQPAQNLWLLEPAVDWIAAWGVHYAVGIDGISLFLVLLTTFLTPLCVLASWKYIQQRVKAYMIAFLLLEMAMLGTFCALDVFLFYVFWEAMLVPMYLIIGVWGGPRRIYAAVKFFLYTMVGSVLMLIALLATYFALPERTFDLFAWYQTGLSPSLQLWCFSAFALAFAIKVPMWPLHTWLPDAHVEAPTAGSVILAGVLLKMGTYGFMRFAIPIYPDAAQTAAPVMVALAVIGIVYGALVAMVQKDVKRLVAYSSVSHLGFVMLGLFAFNAQGAAGGVLQMVNHGISTGALFLLVGVLYERRHTRLISDFGGIAKVMPAYATIFMITTLSSIGLPGTNGFIGEFLVLLGAFDRWMPLAIVATSGVILAAVYMLWMVQRVFFGPVKHEANQGLADLNKREWAYLLPLVLLIFWIGVYPQTFLNKIQPSVERWLTTVIPAKQVAAYQPAALERDIAPPGGVFDWDGQ
ncbi:MAG: NADH-quinone oxidoreductase subunit M [Candidatus Lernaella stagnicola]|nr:NADH-quinone oxidoreductase subunit M [Candidatus Lernaella stagnicola]